MADDARRLHRPHGQSMVEFAILLPMIVLMVMGLMMFGIIFGIQITLTEAAAAGARQAVVEEYCKLSGSGHHNTEIYQAIVKAMGWLGKENIQSITIYEATDDGGIGDYQDVLDKDGNQGSPYNFTNSRRCQLVQTFGYIGVRVRYRQPVFLPMISLITGDEIILQGQRIEIMRP